MTVTNPQETDRPPYRPSDVRLQGVWDAVRSPDVSVVSTDVFDTLVWRQVPEPVDAFPLVAQRLRERGQLHPSLSDLAYGQLREAAERGARGQRGGDREVRLHEIYRMLPPWVFDGQVDHHAAAEVELEVERDLLVPDLDMAKLIEEAQRAGKRTIAVSDTYLSAGELRSLLAQPVLADLSLEFILTSSDHRRNKSGGLFEVAVARLGVSPGQVVHVGDNPLADVEAPRRIGVQTFVFERLPKPLPAIARREARFLPSRNEEQSEAATVSGVAATRARAVSRAEVASLPEPLQGFWKYGASVLGPLFTGFAEWVHEHCRRTGTERVLCLMREGSFLATLLTRANAYLGDDVEARPLWLNRELCWRANIDTLNADDLEALMLGRSPRSVAEFCRLVGVPLSEVPRFVGRADMRLTDPLLRSELIEHIAEKPELRALVHGRVRTIRERIAAYVERESGSADAPVTLVDLGWAGSIQGALHEVLARAGAPRHTVGLYLLTHEGATRQVLGGAEVHGFIGDFGVPESSIKTIMRSPEVLEQVCMPPHGSQLDLDEQLEPVLAANEIPEQQLVEAEATRKGIVAFQREWARYRTALPGKIGPLAGLQRLLRPILLRAVAAPTAEEVGLYGSWQHDEGGGSEGLDTVTDTSVVRQLRHMSPDQVRTLAPADVYWPLGLAGQVDEHWPEMMQAAASGHVPWEALGSPLETGRFSIEASNGSQRPVTAVTAPVRNRLGLSLVSASLRAPNIERLTFRPAQRPCVLRFDWIELRCWRHGHSDPTLVHLDETNGLAGLRLEGDCFKLDPNVLVLDGSSSTLTVELARDFEDQIFGVDVQCAFAALPLQSVRAWTPLSASTSTKRSRFRDVYRAERYVAQMEASLSWRITAPLRAAKRRLS